MLAIACDAAHAADRYTSLSANGLRAALEAVMPTAFAIAEQPKDCGADRKREMP